jgi:hypothetical protein
MPMLGTDRLVHGSLATGYPQSTSCQFFLIGRRSADIGT